VVIAFVLHRDGKVTDMVLKKSSGDEELDQAAWLSIMRCGPYHVFPLDLKNTELSLQITFVYNGKPEASQTPVFTPVFK
jgi:TonB family protein